MIPVMTSFLPPFDTHLYVPVLFKLWEAFNSEVINSRLIELCGDLSEEHKTGNIVKWKDVGIWTDAEWTVLVGKALASMSKHILPEPVFLWLSVLQTSPLAPQRCGFCVLCNTIVLTFVGLEHDSISGRLARREACFENKEERESLSCVTPFSPSHTTDDYLRLACETVCLFDGR